MNDTLVQQVHNSPLKKKYIAKQIGVVPTVLSMCLKGERHLKPHQEEKLKELLKVAV